MLRPWLYGWKRYGLLRQRCWRRACHSSVARPNPSTSLSRLLGSSGAPNWKYIIFNCIGGPDSTPFLYQQGGPDWSNKPSRHISKALDLGMAECFESRDPNAYYPRTASHPSTNFPNILRFKLIRGLSWFATKLQIEGPTQESRPMDKTQHPANYAAERRRT